MGLPRAAFVLGAAWLLAVALITAVTVRTGPSSVATQVLSSGGILVALCVCVVACLRAAQRPTPARRGWTLMAVALGLAALGQTSFVVVAVTQSSAGPPTVVLLIGFLGYSVPILAAILAFPRPHTVLISRFRGLLDVLVITVGFLLISEATILRRLRTLDDSSVLVDLLRLAYPVADVAICAMVLCVGISQRPGDRRTWLFLGAGLVATAVTDSVFVGMGLGGQPGVTSPVVTAGWMLAPVLVTIATLIPMTSREVANSGVTLTVRLVPYVPVLGAVVVLSLTDGADDQFLSVLAALLLVVVTVRQVMMVYENVSLTRDLEAKVATRTAELATLGSIVTSFNDATIGISLGRVIMAWNPAAERLYGLGADDVLGRPPSVLVASGLDGIEDLLDRAELGLPLDAFELDLTRPDGSRVPVAMTVSPIADSHGVQGISVYGQDITERRRSAAALERARQEALESARIKSEFVATMSHEIRTPMNGVIGLTTLLLETPLNDGQRQYAKGVRSAGEALLSVINDILDFSKLEAGKVVLDLEDFNPRRLVDDLGALLAPAATAKGLELIAYCRPDVPRSLRGDPGRIRQILLNLASNAVKFTADGEVVVRVGVVSGTADTVRLRFEVADTGIGIHDQDRARLFDSFSQADASTTRRFGGTGLGLAISARLIEVMGGEIGLESEVGVGTTFWCEVPLRRGLVDLEAPQLPGPDLLNDLRVLVVDDNATNRTILESQLRSWHMQPDSVVNAETALRQLRAGARAGRPYDLAALDMVMPEVDGLELARRIGADPLLRGMPLIMLTSSLQLPHHIFTDAGIGQWLAKPVRSSELYDRLVRLMAPREVELITSRGVSRPSPPVDQGSRGRVLVVEDNDLNQLVAEGALSRLGFAVHTVANGLAALHALEQDSYCAVLMDCHMPVLDGFAATREIRRHEVGRRRMPIIAMTAGALPEDRQRCLDAGMDDYIAKPVDLDALEAILDARAGLAVEPLTGLEPDPVEGEATDDGPLDLTRLVDLMDLQARDGSSLLESMMSSFITRGGDRLIALRRAAVADDTATVLSVVHELKGAAGTIGAVRVAELCRQLEVSVRRGDPPSHALLGELGAELTRANEALRGADLQST